MDSERTSLYGRGQEGVGALAALVGMVSCRAQIMKPVPHVYLPLVWAAVVSPSLGMLSLLVLPSIINNIICFCCDLIDYLIPGTWYVIIPGTWYWYIFYRHF